ncbi:Recombinational DNA repair protein RecT [Salmonella enterica subsp. enterica serovar Give str. S5-487]|nr:Recombinational DNA repair protein RecT [Salmonella enterica subsp. enterica serovar Give str. S5-487]
MIDLARRSGQIASLSARVVREGDDFSFEFGLEEKLVHCPGENEDAQVTHVYAVARLNRSLPTPLPALIDRPEYRNSKNFGSLIVSSLFIRKIKRNRIRFLFTATIDLSL